MTATRGVVVLFALTLMLGCAQRAPEATVDSAPTAMRALPWPEPAEVDVAVRVRSVFGGREELREDVQGRVRVALDHAREGERVFRVTLPESTERWRVTERGVQRDDGVWLWRAEELSRPSDEGAARVVRWEDECAVVTYAPTVIASGWREGTLEEQRRFCPGGAYAQRSTWRYGEDAERTVSFSSAGVVERR